MFMTVRAGDHGSLCSGKDMYNSSNYVVTASMVISWAHAMYIIILYCIIISRVCHKLDFDVCSLFCLSHARVVVWGVPSTHTSFWRVCACVLRQNKAKSWKYSQALDSRLGQACHNNVNFVLFTQDRYISNRHVHTSACMCAWHTGDSERWHRHAHS